MAKSTVGKRYNPNQKNKILSTVKKYNQENGRGGLAFAVQKYNITFNTLRNWSDTVPTKAPKTKSKSRPSERRNPQQKSLRFVIDAKLRKIDALQSKITSIQRVIFKEKSIVIKLLK